MTTTNTQTGDLDIARMLVAMLALLAMPAVASAAASWS